MSSKKNKNKVKNKPPTLQPKTETCETEKSEKDIPIEEVIFKTEERVPEILSEIVHTATENQLPETAAAPKKPKRNKSKKKKNAKSDESEDIQEQTTQVPVSEENKLSLELRNVQEKEEACAISPEITPIARKKKNKNKKQEEPTDKQAQDEIRITSLKKGEEPSDLKIITVVPVETEESKCKKKNKKKKRTDSERSEKADEVLACTAAFQKLLENRDDKKDKEEHIIPTEKTTVSKSFNTEEPTNLLKAESEIVKAESVSEKISMELRDAPREETGKGNKKNKKEKRHPPTGDTDDDIETAKDMPPIVVPTEVKAKEILKMETAKIKEEIYPPAVEERSLIEKSPKPKAKISKPVEKWQKDKADVSTTEKLVEEDIPTLTIKDTPADIQVQGSLELVPIEVKQETERKNPALSPSLQETEIKKYSTKEKKSKMIEVVIPETTIVQDTAKSLENEETLPVEIKTEKKDENLKPFDLGLTTAPDGRKNKKRKKSPKPHLTEIKESVAAKTEFKGESTVSDEIFKLMPDAAEIKSSQSKTKQPETPPDKQGQPTSEAAEMKHEPEAPTKDAVGFSLNIETMTSMEGTRTMSLKTPDTAKISEILKEHTPETQTEKHNIQLPSNRNRKKSPKPKKIDIAPDNIQQDTDPVKEMPREQKEKTSPSMPSLEDIEIKSIKTDESEGSACDIVPDVQYPRASSQLQDDKNYTVIQEIKSSDVKLNTMIAKPDAPLFQGSEEILIITPEIVTTTIKITQDDTPTTSKSLKKEESLKLEEKTDLKSKVLDVNQGMEELRKSIERSLAELNAMEKSEKDAEEQFAKAQAKLEAISDLAVKKSEDKEQVTPSQKAEKAKEKPTKLLEEVNLRKSKERSISPIMDLIKTEQSNKEKSLLLRKETETKILDLASPPTKTGELKNQSLTNIKPTDFKAEEQKPSETSVTIESSLPVPPPKKDNRGKGKKKKGKQETEQSNTTTTSTGYATTSSGTGKSNESTQETKKQEKTEQKTEPSSTQEKGKQQSVTVDTDDTNKAQNFKPIENFEDALTSSNEEDVNKSFEMIANDDVKKDLSQNPEINITGPAEDEEKDISSDSKDEEKINPVSQPKNLLGHPDIPARLNKTDYKKEKNKTPNTKQAKVKIKDDVKDPIEITKQSKESQTGSKHRFLKDKTVTESVSSIINDNEEYIYKYSFRKVFLPSACHVCKKDLKPLRVPCSFCNLIFYCSAKHKDEDYPQHQGLCFAVSTIIHLKDQKHIYADAKNITGQEYRLLRMQMIVSCEKVLKRRLAPWEQEALLYPRICADVGCREWRQNLLADCEGCGQIAYCANNPAHLPSSHQRWCKSYSLYHKLVVYQQTKGRLEPRLPTRVFTNVTPIPDKLNEVLAAMYEEKIVEQPLSSSDMTDTQYATLTQIATAPLTAAFCHQLYANGMNAACANGVTKKSSFTIHIVGAELQFEADALNKWEVFFLHLQPAIKELRVVLIGADLNPSQLPLDLLGNIRMCANCRQNKRRVSFQFHDKKTYHEYWCTDFVIPDLVCAFNASIHRSSVFNGNDPWPATVRTILKLRVPFVLTAHTLTELQRDLVRINDICEKQTSAKSTSDAQVSRISTCDKQVVILSEPKCNPFASVRPDRNFISDDEMPLLFNNYCFSLVSGAF